MNNYRLLRDLGFALVYGKRESNGWFTIRLIDPIDQRTCEAKERDLRVGAERMVELAYKGAKI